jgi:hypothetical protein
MRSGWRASTDVNVCCRVRHRIVAAQPDNAVMRLAPALISIVLVVIAGCGGGRNSDGDPPITSVGTERDIEPATADPRVSTSLEPHVAITPSATAAPANKLFVFLPGTQGLPTYYRLILRSGSARGFHALGINYPNDDSVGSICVGREAACFWDVRREVITGSNSSALVAVAEPDSIVTRLQRTLAYLNTTYPSEGWGQYLVGGSVDWSKIVVAGHSQGGGHAGVMAKLYALQRAVYFSSPADWNVITNQPAAWMSGEPNVTPASRQYAFGNVDDTLVAYGELRLNWAALGLTAFGAPASVDAATAGPFAANHLLVTANPGRSGVAASPTHGSTVLDAATPLDAAGAPVFDAVWGYLCFQ